MIATLARILLWVLALISLRRKRWAYAGFVLMSVLWLPVQAKFQLHPVVCDTSFTADGVMLAAGKFAHIILFFVFGFVTAVQLEKWDVKSLLLAVLATVAFGFIIELEETITRTGNCRMSDLVPDTIGALIAVSLAYGLDRLKRKTTRQPDRSAV